LPGLKAVEVCSKVEPGGYFAFPIIYKSEHHNGLPTSKLIELIREQGLNGSTSPYGLLHGLKIFAEGFDIFTQNRGPLCGDYMGYKEGDFPLTEDVYRRLIFLPLLSEPKPDAVGKIRGMLERAVEKAVQK